MAAEPSAQSRLARLLRDIDHDLAALDERAAETVELMRLSATQELPRAELTLLAVNLHGYYTALETLHERIARLLDDDVPAGPNWHVDLLEQMQVDVPGVRPTVTPSSVAPELHQLRKFRHFFRNAYAVALDATLVKGHGSALMRAHPDVRAAIVRLRSHVERLISAR